MKIKKAIFVVLGCISLGAVSYTHLMKSCKGIFFAF